MSETTNPSNVTDMAAYRARRAAESFNPNAEMLGDAIEAASNPPIAPVTEVLPDGRAHVRTVEGNVITFSPHREGYESDKVNLAPESQELFTAALQITGARGNASSLLADASPIPNNNNATYINAITQPEQKAA